MDSPNEESDPVPRHQPEFEFWPTNAATSPLLSADELFSNGVLLPLHLLHLHPSNDPEPDPEPHAAPTGWGPSKRWKDIFRKGGLKEKNKKKSERSGTELNINIWPFSRSRSAGTGATRPKLNPTRKASSAPCSRSNSAGESKSRKWPSSPGRVGVHLGRASPVWQVRRKKPAAASGLKPGRVGSGRVLNLNVPMCIGYGQQVGDGDGTRGSNMFNLRSLFTKKVY